MPEFYKGDIDILYILVGSEYLPIGCLTSNGFEESSDEVPTTTRDNAGWKTSRPTNQSYSISFEGIETLANELSAYVTYKGLENLKLNRTLITYRLGSLTGKRKQGQGYITNLSKTSPAGELVEFSGTLTGYGKYEDYDPTTNNFFNYELDFIL